MVLYMYLSRHVPCYYLEAMAQEAAASPKSAKCWYFKTQDEAMKIQKLSRCKIAEYCSRDCQIADWKVRLAKVANACIRNKRVDSGSYHDSLGVSYTLTRTWCAPGFEMKRQATRDGASNWEKKDTTTVRYICVR
jgi:hypothetical protein